MVRVAVLGGGLLGVKIAGNLAYHGHTVKLHDRSTQILNSVPLRIEEDKQELKQDGILLQPNYPGRVICLSQLEDAVHDVDFVFEAVVDSLQVKQELFERVSHFCKHDAIVATNTLNIDVDAIVQEMTNKERALGLRFLFPVHCIPEIEMTTTAYTSTGTVQKVKDFMERMGKTLFLRSGPVPLILDEEQRETRKQDYMSRLKNQRHLGYAVVDRLIPQLAHRGNIAADDSDFDTEHQPDEQDCAICMDSPRNCVLRQCHHMCTCIDCGQLLLHRRDCCPICRKEISEVIRVFHS